MDSLAAQGIAAPFPPGVAPVEVLLARYSRYLLAERALAPSTARLYGKRVRRFLACCAPDGSLRSLCADQAIAAVLAECETVSVGSAQYFCGALRSFLRFCYLERLSDADLSAAALAVPGSTNAPKGCSALPWLPRWAPPAHRPTLSEPFRNSSVDPLPGQRRANLCGQGTSRPRANALRRRSGSQDGGRQEGGAV